MTIVLYDLAGLDDRRFSPWCWPTRMALAHKGADFEARATTFSDIAGIPGGDKKTLPTITHKDEVVVDSLVIAQYLEHELPGPSLFGGQGGVSGSRFMHNWVGTTVIPGVVKLVLLDIFNHLQPQDHAYFRTSREERFGQSLEAVQAGREDRVQAFGDSLMPARLILKKQPFLGGDRPMYLDYQLFGPLQWARVISDFELLQADDAVLDWFSRCLDLHDAEGRKVPGYWG